jgi:hypothetical protein
MMTTSVCTYRKLALRDGFVRHAANLDIMALFQSLVQRAAE